MSFSRNVPRTFARDTLIGERDVSTYQRLLAWESLESSSCYVTLRTPNARFAPGWSEFNAAPPKSQLQFEPEVILHAVFVTFRGEAFHACDPAVELRMLLCDDQTFRSASQTSTRKSELG